MNKKIGIGFLLIMMMIAPWFVYPVFLIKILCFALFACAFNLLLGYTGLLSFGHAAFFGGAGYISGYALKYLGVPVELGLVIGVLYSAALGFVMGGLAIRRQGIYFTMITLALAQMVYFIFLQAPFTGGEEGLQGVPRGSLLGGLISLKSDTTLYYFILIACVLCAALISRVIHSPFGQVVRSIKDNEARAISLGYDVNKYKLTVFVLSASLAGLAGSLKVLLLGFETLSDVHWGMSGLVILMTLVGGMGTLYGPMVGAVVVLLLENKLVDLGVWLASVTHIEWFTSLGENVSVVTGVIFVLCVLLFRRGIVGEILAYSRKSKLTAV